MKRRILALLALILAFVFVLSSCNADEKNSKTNGDDSTEQTQSGKTEGEEDTEAAKLKKYNRALELIDEGNYEKAYSIFKELGDYKASKLHLERFRYVPVSLDRNNGETIMSFSYNEKNLLVEYIEINSDGTQYFYQYSYDSNGRLIKEFNDYGDKYSIDEHTYDANGYIIKTVDYNSAYGTATTEYTRNAKGDIIKSVRTRHDGTQYVSEYEYEYDDRGNIIKAVYGTPEDGMDVVEYFYDSNNNIIKEINMIIDESQNVVASGSAEYSYNENGDIIKEHSVGESENFSGESISEYTYYSNGKLEWGKITSVQNGASYVEEVFCDENGNATTIIYYYPDGTVEIQERVNEYSYDSKGNCIKWTAIEQDGSQCIIEYDSSGNIIKRSVIDADGKMQYCAVTYKLVYISTKLHDSVDRQLDIEYEFYSFY